MTFLEELKKAKEKILSTNSTIQLVSHYDADGITSAAIMIKTLESLGKKYEVKIVKKIKPDTIKEITRKEPELVIFTDLGSSYLTELRELDSGIIILDHHEVAGELGNAIHINPLLFEMEEMSGSCVTFLLAREMVKDDDLAPLALVGAIGDLALNDISFFKNNPNIKIEKGLKVFGRLTRPLHQVLTYSDVLENIESEASAIQFLTELGIDLKNEEGWKTLSDLTEKEKQKLNDALIKEHFEHPEEIFGDTWTLNNFKDELRDGKEFATILNACSRLERSDIALNLCLKKEGSLKDARKLVASYRRTLSKYLRWVEDGNSIEKENVTFILGNDFISENIIGTIASIFSRSSKNPIIALTNAEDGIKISARALNGVNINSILSGAVEKVGGMSGGHHEAAGATIPKGKEDEFMKECEKLMK